MYIYCTQIYIYVTRIYHRCGAHREVDSRIDELPLPCVYDCTRSVCLLSASSHGKDDIFMTTCDMKVIA